MNTDGILLFRNLAKLIVLSADMKKYKRTGKPVASILRGAIAAGLLFKLKSVKFWGGQNLPTESQNSRGYLFTYG